MVTAAAAASDGRWSIASDGVQWVLRRRQGQRWVNMVFVSSDRDILARCMRERGVPPAELDAMLDGLPEKYNPHAPGRGVLTDAIC